MDSLKKIRVGRLLAIGLPIGVLLAGLFLPGWRPRDFLSAHWQTSLPRVADQQLRPTMRRLADLGDDQLDFLVRQLGSDQERIARAAGETLDEQLIRWKLLPSKLSLPKVAEIARCIALHVPDFRGDSKRYASELAVKILAWPTDRQTIDSAALVAHCDTILREASRGESPSPTSMAAIGNRKSNYPKERSTNPTPPRTLDVDATATLTVPEFVAPALPPLRDSSEPLQLSTTENADNSKSGESKMVSNRRGRISIGDDATDAADSDDDTRLRPNRDEWANYTTLEVIQKLQSPNVYEAAHAAEEFRRRGFNERHMRLAQQLTSPNIETRRKLAELLPLMGGVDVRPWLVWLSQDDDARVRLAAVSVMSTSDDPAIRERLQEMEGQESDVAVLRLVQRKRR